MLPDYQLVISVLSWTASTKYIINATLDCSSWQSHFIDSLNYLFFNYLWMLFQKLACNWWSIGTNAKSCNKEFILFSEIYYTFSNVCVCSFAFHSHLSCLKKVSLNIVNCSSPGDNYICEVHVNLSPFSIHL